MKVLPNGFFDKKTISEKFHRELEKKRHTSYSNATLVLILLKLLMEYCVRVLEKNCSFVWLLLWITSFCAFKKIVNRIFWLLKHFILFFLYFRWPKEWNTERKSTLASLCRFLLTLCLWEFLASKSGVVFFFSQKSKYCTCRKKLIWQLWIYKNVQNFDLFSSLKCLFITKVYIYNFSIQKFW